MKIIILLYRAFCIVMFCREICYEIYKSSDFQLIEFENVDIGDKELLIDISNKIEAIVTECGGIQLMYENLFEKYW